jgi:alkylhydroperoxidase/carboxymuconolactone decarboxylase family protein YurZ
MMPRRAAGGQLAQCAALVASDERSRIVRSHEEKLRRLALNDTERVLHLPCATLDARTRAILDLAVLIAVNGPASSFDTATSAAMAAGATEDELVEILIAAAPMVGTPNVVAAAPKLALAMGYDVDAALEGLVADDLLH